MDWIRYGILGKCLRVFCALLIFWNQCLVTVSACIDYNEEARVVIIHGRDLERPLTECDEAFIQLRDRIKHDKFTEDYPWTVINDTDLTLPFDIFSWLTKETAFFNSGGVYCYLGEENLFQPMTLGDFSNDGDVTFLAPSSSKGAAKDLILDIGDMRNEGTLRFFTETESSCPSWVVNIYQNIENKGSILSNSFLSVHNKGRQFLELGGFIAAYGLEFSNIDIICALIVSGGARQEENSGYVNVVSDRDLTVSGVICAKGKTEITLNNKSKGQKADICAYFDTKGMRVKAEKGAPEIYFAHNDSDPFEILQNENPFLDLGNYLEDLGINSFTNVSYLGTDGLKVDLQEGAKNVVVFNGAYDVNGPLSIIGADIEVKEKGHLHVAKMIVSPRALGAPKQRLINKGHVSIGQLCQHNQLSIYNRHLGELRVKGDGSKGSKDSEKLFLTDNEGFVDSFLSVVSRYSERFFGLKQDKESDIKDLKQEIRGTIFSQGSIKSDFPKVRENLDVLWSQSL